MSHTIERRSAGLEVRTKGRRLEGYAALFGVSADLGTFTESIRAGAFTNAIRAGDVLALIDHDQSQLLGRTRSKTLRLSEDTRGLAFDIDLPETQAGRDLLALAERGDVGGASFGFSISKGGDSWRGNHRELLTIDLKEISIVKAWPAYEGTVVQARSLQNFDAPRLRLARAYLETMRGL